MATATRVEPTTVGPNVVCGECKAVMEPMHYRALSGDQWLFWRCGNEHVTCALLLPPAFVRHVT